MSAFTDPAYLDAWTCRIRSARIIAKVLIDMKGGAVKPVFEVASGGTQTVALWQFADNVLSIEAIERGTGLRRTYTAQVNGRQLEQVAAELGHNSMADLKIKGLADIVAQARAGIAQVRQAASGVGESAKSFVATAAEVQKQIDAAHDDLKFEATQLGNAGPESSGQSGT